MDDGTQGAMIGVGLERVKMRHLCKRKECQQQQAEPRGEPCPARLRMAGVPVWLEIDQMQIFLVF